MYIDWNKEKNEQLKKERNISFDEISVIINDDKILKVVPHYNLKKYPNQLIMHIEMDNYIYLVPFVMDDDKMFLKTIIPSRKATKEYKRGLKNEKKI